MKAHDLAKILLDGPNLPIATHANNHTASNCRIRVCTIKTANTESIGIGNFLRKLVNYPNEYVLEEIDGGDPLPVDWH